MNIFGQLYNALVFRPLLNLLQLLYDATGDIGISIILMAIGVNLLMWPLFIQTYLNSQKLRYLQPQLKAIQEKYKDDREKLLQEQIKFNRKHGISNGSFLLVLLLQILIASGLYVLTRQVSEGVEIEGLYKPVFDTTTATFSTEAFGSLDIGKVGREYIIFPITAAVLSFMYGFYTQKLAPKLPELPKKKKKKGEEESPFDPEAMQKSMGFQMLFFMPIVLFGINYTIAIGLNIYLIIVNLLSLIRQIFITNYYKNHIVQFFEDLSKTDPEFSDNVDILTDSITDQEVATKVLELDDREAKLPKKKKIAKKKQTGKTGTKKKATKKTTKKK